MGTGVPAPSNSTGLVFISVSPSSSSLPSNSMLVTAALTSSASQSSFAYPNFSHAHPHAHADTHHYVPVSPTSLSNNPLMPTDMYGPTSLGNPTHDPSMASDFPYLHAAPSSSSSSSDPSSKSFYLSGFPAPSDSALSSFMPSPTPGLPAPSDSALSSFMPSPTPGLPAPSDSALSSEISTVPAATALSLNIESLLKTAVSACERMINGLPNRTDQGFLKTAKKLAILVLAARFTTKNLDADQIVIDLLKKIEPRTSSSLESHGNQIIEDYLTDKEIGLEAPSLYNWSLKNAIDSIIHIIPADIRNQVVDDPRFHNLLRNHVGNSGIIMNLFGFKTAKRSSSLRTRASSSSSSGLSNKDIRRSASAIAASPSTCLGNNLTLQNSSALRSESNQPPSTSQLFANLGRQNGSTEYPHSSVAAAPALPLDQWDAQMIENLWKKGVLILETLIPKFAKCKDFENVTKKQMFRKLMILLLASVFIGEVNIDQAKKELFKEDGIIDKIDRSTEKFIDKKINTLIQTHLKQISENLNTPNFNHFISQNFYKIVMYTLPANIRNTLIMNPATYRYWKEIVETNSSIMEFFGFETEASSSSAPPLSTSALSSSSSLSMGSERTCSLSSADEIAFLETTGCLGAGSVFKEFEWLTADTGSSSTLLPSTSASSSSSSSSSQYVSSPSISSSSHPLAPSNHSSAAGFAHSNSNNSAQKRSLDRGEFSEESPPKRPKID